MRKIAVMLKAFNLFIAILACGCTLTGDTNRQCVGRPVSELVAALGAPDSNIPLEDDRKILMWTSFDSPGQVVPCRESFTVSAEGVIEHSASSYCPPEQKTFFYRNLTPFDE